MKYEENRSQSMLVSWFKRQYQPYQDLFFCIPNGVATNALVGARMKKAGVVSGVPDLFAAIAATPYHGLFIEMKAPKGKLSENQKKIHALLLAEGYQVKVAYSFEEGREIIQQYLQSHLT